MHGGIKLDEEIKQNDFVYGSLNLDEQEPLVQDGLV
jgi:hypothetical protein